MPRSNRPRRGGRRPGPSSGSGTEPDADGDLGGLGAAGRQRSEVFGGVEHAVRSITGAAAVKTYRCPGCDHEIPAGTPHVVAWPLQGPVHLSTASTEAPGRRHWHTPCWNARTRRGPRR